MSLALERIQSWLDNLITVLPNFIMAMIVSAFFYYSARIIAHFLRKRLTTQNREDFGNVISNLIKRIIISCGVFIAMILAMPDLKPSDLVNWLILGSLVIGIIYREVLQNYLCGILILLRQPFKAGDSIQVGDIEGKVEKIAVDITMLKTDDALKVIIPNSLIYSKSILVNTHTVQRNQHDIKIDRKQDIATIQKLIKKAIRNIDGVEHEPGVKTLVQDLTANKVIIRISWWTDNSKTDALQVKSDVIESLKLVLDKIYFQTTDQTPLTEDMVSTSNVDINHTNQGIMKEKEERKGNISNRSNRKAIANRNANNISPITGK